MSIETADGRPFVPARLGIRGLMPSHGHGFDVEPRVAGRIDAGSYLIDGMRFHMNGDWLLTVGIEGPGGIDTASFAIEIGIGPDSGEPSILRWNENEVAFLNTLTVARLPNSLDTTNRFSGSAAAAELGEQLFFDKALSATGTVACATCHQPELKFTDGVDKSIGTAKTKRNAPTLIGSSHNRWFYWDGRRDSLWAQAITPLETYGEMDNNRVDVLKLVAEKYGSEYTQLTGQQLADVVTNLPDGAGPFADKDAWGRHAPSRTEAGQFSLRQYRQISGRLHRNTAALARPLRPVCGGPVA